MLRGKFSTLLWWFRVGVQLSGSSRAGRDSPWKPFSEEFEDSSSLLRGVEGPELSADSPERPDLAIFVPTLLPPLEDPLHRCTLGRTMIAVANALSNLLVICPCYSQIRLPLWIWGTIVVKIGL